jgi:ferredoxin-type protein NapF
VVYFFNHFAPLYDFWEYRKFFWLYFNFMLKKLRVLVSLTVFCLISLYFLDLAGIVPSWVGRLAEVQFVPAWISHNFAVFACLAAATLLFGRIYCSSICPMGAFQDVVIRCSRKKMVYRKNSPALRWAVLGVCLLAFHLGFAIALGMLDPYSAYGRMAVHLFKPVYMCMNNGLAKVFNHFGNYAFYHSSVVLASVFSLIAALLTFAAISVMAWARGRLYCNAICPVGTVLGFASKFSLFKIRIDKNKCVSCGLCEKKCKAQCIDAKNKSIDYSRCVNCFNCIDSCKGKGIRFGFAHRPAVAERSLPVAERSRSRRKFLLAGLAAAAVPKVAFAQASEASNSSKAVSPPGAVSEKHLLARCTACHLCVSKCPSKALKPAFMEYGLGGMMMPLMNFEKGFCNFDCTACADVCPSDALVQITKEQKHRLQVGRVVFEPELCVVHTEGYSCGACSEHCPTQAVKMVPYKDGLTHPFIDTDICVGCGGCEFICPVRPKRAIHVEGNKVHQQARAFDVEEKDEKEIMDFGF